MWLRIFYRLRQTWVRVALWKRAVAIGIGLCLLIQLAFGLSLWREAQFRQQLAGRARLYLGKSPLSLNVQASLGRFTSSERLQLLVPVEAVSIVQPTDDDFRSISGLNIKRLTIRFRDLGARELQHIGWVSQLEALELDCDTVDEQGLAPLADCRKLRSLKILGRLAPEALSPLQRCVSLSKLHVSVMSVFATDSKGSLDSITRSHLVAAAQIPNLKCLTLHSPGINISVLGGLAGAQRLEELYLYKVDLHQVHPQDGSLNGLSQLPRLRLLSLSVDPSYYVEPLEGFPALSTLALHGARISPQFLASLRRLPHLGTLSFTKCFVNDSLSALAKNSKLKRLNLMSTDADVEGVRRIGRLYSLEVLRIPGFQDGEEFRDLFPRLQSPSAFDWGFVMDQEVVMFGAPLGGGGMF